MSKTVRIPIDDGGWIEVQDDDPRAIEYERMWGNIPQKPVPKAAPPRPSTPRQAPNGIYTVQPGDSLSAIAQDLLGDAKLFSKIAQINQLSNINLILAGQQLIIPNSAAPASGGGAGASGSGNGAGIGTGARAPAAGYDLTASMGLGRSFMFIVFEQLPNIGATTSVIRKVAVVPRDFAFVRPQTFGTRLSFPWGVGALKPANPAGTLSMADHVMNLNPGGSQFLSASDRAFAAGTMEGTPLLIDVAKVKAAGGQVFTTDEIVAELTSIMAKNGQRSPQIEQLIRTIRQVEGEVLIQGGVPAGASKPITWLGSPQHRNHIEASDKLFKQYKEGAISADGLEAGLGDIGRSYTRMRVVGRVGRVLTVVGVVLTVVDLGLAGRESVRRNSIKPITAEVVRQIGGWGGAIAGAKIGAMIGAACGIETGPGAIVTGAVGALFFGTAGYLGADLLADQISPN